MLSLGTRGDQTVGGVGGGGGGGGGGGDGDGGDGCSPRRPVGRVAS